MVSYESDLPVELWNKILNKVPFSVSYLLVCKRWQQAMYGRHELTIAANKKVKEIGLMKILEKFSSLKAIKFVVGNAFSPSLLHDIALQFTGSQTLRCIHSVSDYIIYGAEFCPKLQYLSMPVVEPGSRFAFGNSRGNDFNVTLHRDLGYILKSNTNLEHLRLDSPVCDMVIDPQLVSNLKSLCLTSMHQNVIQMFSYTLANRLALPSWKLL